jgi:hypothetical protein
VAAEPAVLARQFVGDRDRTGELVQQRFLGAPERLGSFESSRRLVPWLVGILVILARVSRGAPAGDCYKSRVRCPHSNGYGQFRFRRP